MAVAVFLLQGLLLRDVGSLLAPLSVLENDLVASGKNLKWSGDLIKLVELYGAGFAKDLEVRWVYKVTHRYTVHIEAQGLDWVSHFICVNRLRIRAGSHHIDGRVYEHLEQFMRCGHAHQFAVIDGRLYEHLGDWQPIGG